MGNSLVWFDIRHSPLPWSWTCLGDRSRGVLKSSINQDLPYGEYKGFRIRPTNIDNQCQHYVRYESILKYINKIFINNFFISYRNVLLFPVVFNQTTDTTPLCMPENKPSTSLFLDGKQSELLSQNTMISSLSFFQPLLVYFQLLRTFPSCSIDTLRAYSSNESN